MFLTRSSSRKPPPAPRYRCGTAGGTSVALLPNDRSFLVSQIAVTGCAAGVRAPRAPTLPTTPTLPGRRRDLLQLPVPGSAPIAMAAGKFNVTAVPIANLPIDAATGLPKTPPLGNIVSAGGPAFPNANWMGQMASVLGKKTISNVVLPGTHDSGTSGIDTYYTYAEKTQVSFFFLQGYGRVGRQELLYLCERFQAMTAGFQSLATRRLASATGRSSPLL